MHIVFKRVPLKRGYTLIAEVRRTYRRNGSVRSQMVVYVASIRAAYIPLLVARKDFWMRADCKLDALNLPAFERAKLERRIEQRVPRP
jgi:hypothetical protein